MSLFQKLCETYDENIGAVGKLDEKGNILSAVSHKIQDCQIEVTIDINGDFLSAKILDKDDSESKTMIPVTESSASRSSGISPHPLVDTLSYIAGDYSKYCEKNDRARSKEKFDTYIFMLKVWGESEFSNDKIIAIYKYLNKAELISDLAKSGIVKLKDNLFSREKISGKPYEQCYVRFVVYGSSNGINESWKDSDIINLYIKYYEHSQNKQKGICYISGKEDSITENHPKGVLRYAFGAKLISANDNANFTYRGRFVDSSEASSVGYTDSQKAHSALTWLIAKQGVIKKGRTYVCWCPGSKVKDDISDLLFGFSDDDYVYSGEEYRDKLTNLISGRKKELIASNDVVILGMEAATTGRLSVVYYKELLESDFLNRIYAWYNSVKWYFWSDKKQIIKTPDNADIINCAYGIEGEQFLDTADKIFKEQYQRILNCIINGARIPKDLIDSLFERASHPADFKKHYNHEKILSVACALIAKKYLDYGKGEYETMSLDMENYDRSYLFGRLLAVLERVEKTALSQDITRETNAIRLQPEFVNKPMYTWNLIEQRLNPYFSKLNPGSRKYYKDIISEITGKLMKNNPSRVELNKKLSDTYLLGYYLQRADFYKSNKNNIEKMEESV